MKSFMNSFIVMTFAFSAHGAMAQGISSATTSATDQTCRAKAKEIATQTYNTCVTDSRNAQIEQIRSEYQKQVADLKARYDKELKKMGSKESLKEFNDTNLQLGSTNTSGNSGTTTAAKSRPTSEKTRTLPNKVTATKEITSTDITLPARTAMKKKTPKTSASTGSKPTATKGIAKTLPTRKEVKGQAAPIASTPITIEQTQDDASAMSEEPSNTPPLPSSDEAAAAAAAQNDMQLTLVPSSESGNEQY